MRRFQILRRRLYQQLFIIATLAIIALTGTATRSEAGRVVVKVGAPRHHRVVVRTAVVKPATRQVWKPGHWEYRSATGRHVWVPGRWVVIR